MATSRSVGSSLTHAGSSGLSLNCPARVGPHHARLDNRNLAQTAGTGKELGRVGFIGDGFEDGMGGIDEGQLRALERATRRDPQPVHGYTLQRIEQLQI